MQDKPLNLSMHCTCGESLVAKTAAVELADAILQLFAKRHSGEGHAPCQPATQRKLSTARQRSHRHKRTA